MYAVIRKYKFDPNLADDISRIINESFIPIIKEANGVKTYCWFDNGDGTGASFGLFDTKEEAIESTRLAGEYVKEKLVGLLGIPEITEGEVKAQI